MPLAISLLVIVSAAACSGTTLVAGERPRYALVIGHSGYKEKLTNVVNDRNDMCAMLNRLRFKATCLSDLPNRTAFIAEVDSFMKGVPPGATVLLYYAGHAVQIAGENYLIPTGPNAKDPGGLLPQFVPLSELFEISKRARASFQFIVLDACRNNPRQDTLRTMLTTVRGSDDKFEVSYGITRVNEAPPNTLVLYATGSGASALDGDGERNGPLTKHLLLQMQRPQLTISEAINNVVQDVSNDTERRYQNRQEPKFYGSFPRGFCFNGCPGKDIVVNPM